MKSVNVSFLLLIYNALTKTIKKKELQKNSIDIATFYLATGLDLKKSIFFSSKRCKCSLKIIFISVN